MATRETCLCHVRLAWLALLFVSVQRVHLAAPHDSSEQADAPLALRANLRAPYLVTTKVLCLVVVFVVTFVGGILPYFCKLNHGFLVLGTQFAGGIFLSTALLHFLSDSNETFKDRTYKEYPFAFMLAAAGYILTMFGDTILQSIFLEGSVVSDKSIVQEDDCKEVAMENGGVNPREVRVHGKHTVAAVLVRNASLSDTILLILALGFHSVFEGVAIGVAETTADAWRALGTISLHKVFAALAMGIALLRMLPSRPLLSTALYSFAFAISSPVGIAIGVIFDAATAGVVTDWMYAIAMGLASGVFIYVAINHLLAKGYIPDCEVKVDTPFCKFLAASLGVAVIAVVMIWD